MKTTISAATGQQMVEALRELLNVNGIEEAQIMLVIVRPGESPESNCLVEWFTTSDEEACSWKERP